MNLDSGSELSVNQRACPVPRREAEDPVYAHHSQPPEDPVYAYHWPPPETHDVKEKPRSGDFHLYCDTWKSPICNIKGANREATRPIYI